MEFDRLYNYLIEQFNTLLAPSDPYKGAGGRITTVLRKPSGFKGDFGGCAEVSSIPPNMFPQYSDLKKTKKKKKRIEKSE